MAELHLIKFYLIKLLAQYFPKYAWYFFSAYSGYVYGKFLIGLLGYNPNPVVINTFF